MTTPTVTASFRRRRPGPETDLIDWFLHALPIKPPPGCRVTAFREPRLESGFPDLVLVIWNIETAKRWKPIRASLKTHDIRVMQHITKCKSVSLDALSYLFADKAKKSLENSKKPRWSGEQETRGSSIFVQVFAAKHIVAIEAKISEWSAAIEQASLNTWFASSSYVLVPHIPRKSQILASATLRGVGVWTKSETPQPRSIPTTRRLPLSYASWFFNEWPASTHGTLTKRKTQDPKMSIDLVWLGQGLLGAECDCTPGQRRPKDRLFGQPQHRWRSGAEIIHPHHHPEQVNREMLAVMQVQSPRVPKILDHGRITTTLAIPSGFESSVLMAPPSHNASRQVRLIRQSS